MKKKKAPQLNSKISRLFDISIKSIDEETRSVDFVFSDDSLDRYGERVDQASWDTKNYEANPIFLWGHDPRNMENVLGTGGNLRTNQKAADGRRESILTAQFADAETNPKADLAFRMVKGGLLRTVSAGFIPHSLEWDEDTPVLKDNELLEVSLVGIPANPNAVALSFKAGQITQRDATYLIKSMRDEAEALEAQVKAADDAPDLEARIAELEAQLADANTKNDQLATQNEELKAAAADGEGLPAKGGDDDQPGAGDDLDLEAELSEEEISELDVEDEETNE